LALEFVDGLPPGVHHSAAALSCTADCCWFFRVWGGGCVGCGLYARTTHNTQRTTRHAATYLAAALMTKRVR
jgi:hypothetical protein